MQINDLKFQCPNFENILHLDLFILRKILMIYDNKNIREKAFMLESN